MTDQETKKIIQTNRFKRLPENSHTILLRFTHKKDRDDCINSEDFKKVFGELATLLINYNCSIETIKWDYITGSKK